MLKKLKRRLETRYRELFARSASLGKLQRGLQLGVLVARKFRADRGPDGAAGLAFASVLSFIPLLFLTMTVFGHLFGFAEKLEEFKDFLVSQFDPDAREAVAETLGTFVSSLNTQLETQGGFTPVALVLVLLAAMGGFRTAERVFTRIWCVDVSRNTVQRFQVFWSILTLIPIVLGTSFLPDFSGSGDVARVVSDFARQVLVPITVAFFAFLILFVALPNARVRLNAAAIGALVSAIAWVVCSEVFVAYLRHFATSGVYGTLGVAPVFLLWVYVSWIVAIVGAEISYCVQNFRALVREIRAEVHVARVTDPVLGVLVVDRVYDGFSERDERPTVESIAVALDLPLDVVERVCIQLVRAGFVIENASDELGPQLASDRLSLRRVMAAFSTNTGFGLPRSGEAEEDEDESSPVRQFLHDLGQRVDEDLENVTFADLAEQKPAPAEPTSEALPGAATAEQPGLA